ncbi:hypothetical protein V6N13_132947 [Hibiscus sabdariffa]|uniref:Uncharacterized protein n=1 Tax=Hibiscus sabdariffa TaxID=183260 RepID=A0ABR2PWS4_9ROSI
MEKGKKVSGNNRGPSRKERSGQLPTYNLRRALLFDFPKIPPLSLLFPPSGHLHCCALRQSLRLLLPSFVHVVHISNRARFSLAIDPFLATGNIHGVTAAN